jgi:hypothetical protein
MGTVPLSLTNIHIRYAQVGFHSQSTTGTILTLNHSQLVDCIQGIHIGGTGSGCGCGPGCGSIAVVLNNTLMASTIYPFYLSADSYPINIGFYHCTVDHGSAVVAGSYAYAVNVVSTNSSFTYDGAQGLGTWSGDKNGFYGNTGNWSFGTDRRQPSTSSPCQSAGAGSFYLAAGGSNPYRGGGSPYISTTLLNDLKQRTVDPPDYSTYANTTITADTKLAPGARDTGSPPSVGYHYDPIDWALANCHWAANLVLAPGTIIAAYATGSAPSAPALTLNAGAQLFSIGTPAQAVWIVEYNTVQESPGTWQKTTGGSVVSTVTSQTPLPTVNCRFTKWSMLATDDNNFSATFGTGPLSLRDCEFYGGKISSTAPTLNLINCLFDRVQTTSTPSDAGYATYLQNNTFHGGALTLSASDWVIKDNILDKALTTISGTHSASHNAYVNVSPYGAIPGDSSVIALTASPTYALGPIGSYYLSSTGNSSLINGDATLAASAVGLYHYTAKTDQSKEGNSSLSIGYHYVALNSGNGPIDTKADQDTLYGAPPLGDYLKDSNGNGLPDDGDIADRTASHKFRRVDANNPAFYCSIHDAYYGDSMSRDCTNPASSAAGAGDIILVENGTYTETSENLYLRNSGAVGAPITLRAVSPGGAAIDPKDQSRGGVSQAIYIEGNYHVVRDFEIKRAKTTGVALFTANPPTTGQGSYNQILNNHIHDNGHSAGTANNGQSGIYSDRGTGYNIYAGNYVHDNGRPTTDPNYGLDHGLYLTGSTGDIAANNLIVRNAAYGIQVSGVSGTTVATMTSLSIYNNTIVANGHGGIVFYGYMDGVDVANNIMYGHSTGYGIHACDPFAGGSGRPVLIRHNLFNANGTDISTPCTPNLTTCDAQVPVGSECTTFTITSSISGDPYFVNAGSDWHILSGSPPTAVGNGVNLSATPAVDYDFEGSPSPHIS